MVRVYTRRADAFADHVGLSFPHLEVAEHGDAPALGIGRDGKFQEQRTTRARAV